MNKIAKLRNTSFTNAIFTKCKFNHNPKPIMNALEGYDFLSELNRYPFVFDKILLESFKEYHSHQEYNEANIYESTWGDPEIFSVEFKKTLIIKTEIDRINFFSINCDHTTFNSVTFKHMAFERSCISNSTFECCTFYKCTFNNIQFSQTQFNNCIFTNSSYKDCILNNKFNDSQFNGILFYKCVIPAKSFTDCKLDNIEIYNCINNDYLRINAIS